MYPVRQRVLRRIQGLLGQVLDHSTHPIVWQLSSKAFIRSMSMSTYSKPSTAVVGAGPTRLSKTKPAGPLIAHTLSATMAHASIISKIPAAFDRALASGDLLFFPSTVVKHPDLGIDYEIRVCPALQKKPTAPLPGVDPAVDAGVAVQGDKGKMFDPFAPPYNQNLLVDELRDEENDEEFVILLNKFSVVPHHFLLVTKEFKTQTSALTPPELLQTYLLLAASKRNGKKFFAFYNCGGNSGASQPHKHIQFIPADPEDGPPLERLTRNAQIEIPGRPFTLSNLPYASYTFRLPAYFETFTADQMEPILARAFIQLLDLVVTTVRHDPDYPSGVPSYNVILTLEHMHVVPRKHETHTLSQNGEHLPVNSLGFAGLLLVKSEQELAAVKQESIGTILRGVGVGEIPEEAKPRCG